MLIAVDVTDDTGGRVLDALPYNYELYRYICNAIFSLFFIF